MQRLSRDLKWSRLRHQGIEDESIKAFAGENYERAVVEPIVSHLFERFDDDATHYAVVAEDA